MRILHICPRYAPAHGGAEDYSIRITKWMASNPDNVVDVWTTDALEVDALWFPGKKKVEVLEENIDGVNVKRFKTTPFLMNNLFINKSIRWILTHSPIQLMRILGTPPTCFDMWMKVFDKELPKYDVVHVVSMPYFSLLYIARAIAKKVGAKLYMTSLTHIGTGKDDPLRKKYFDPVGIQFYLDSDKVFTLTDTERDSIIDFVKGNGKDISKEKFETVGIGVDVENVLSGDGKGFREKYNLGDNPLVCAVGAKNYVKGSITLVKAMEILWKEGIDVKLGLAGNPTMEFNSFFEKQSNLVKGNTINLDTPTDPQKFDMLAASNIFVMTSKSESFGIVYLEAWIRKLPVIAARIDIMKEIVNEGADGMLVEFDNPKELAEKIKELLSNKEKRDMMGEAGNKKVYERYTWEKIFNILSRYFNV
jgi:glycosyltransferase involved in cell wall biosynthesis